MDTFELDIEELKALARAFGAVVKEGKGGVTVNGRKMSGDELFAQRAPLMDEGPLIQLTQETEANCAVDGYMPVSITNKQSEDIALYAA